MRSIELDASGWNVPLDFYDALLMALGAPDWHGRSINALADTMIWSDETNAVNPPYIVKIANTALTPQDVRQHLQEARDWLSSSRQEFRDVNGHDVDVSLELL